MNKLIEKIEKRYVCKINALVEKRIERHSELCEVIRRFGNGVICEKRGLNDEIKVISKEIVDYVYDYITNNKPNDEGKYTFVVKDEKIQNSSFFVNSQFNLQIELSNEIISKEGGYNTNESHLKKVENEIYKLDTPIFDIQVICPYMRVGNMLKICLYHELTHAYEDYKLLVNNVSYSLKDTMTGNTNKYAPDPNLSDEENILNYYTTRSVYERALEWLRLGGTDDIAKMVANVLYMTNESEMKSFVAQAHEEISSFEYINFGNLSMILPNIEVYQNILYLEKAVDTIKHMSRTDLEDLRGYLMVCLDAKDTKKEYIRWFLLYIEKKLNYLYARIARIISMRFYGGTTVGIKKVTQQYAAIDKDNVNLGSGYNGK